MRFRSNASPTPSRTPLRGKCGHSRTSPAAGEHWLPGATCQAACLSLCQNRTAEARLLACSSAASSTACCVSNRHSKRSQRNKNRPQTWPQAYQKSLAGLKAAERAQGGLKEPQTGLLGLKWKNHLPTSKHRGARARWPESSLKSASNHNERKLEPLTSLKSQQKP